MNHNERVKPLSNRAILTLQVSMLFCGTIILRKAYTERRVRPVYPEHNAKGLIVPKGQIGWYNNNANFYFIIISLANCDGNRVLYTEHQ